MWNHLFFRSGPQKKYQHGPELLSPPFDKIISDFIKQGDRAFHGIAKTDFKLIKLLSYNRTYNIKTLYCHIMGVKVQNR
jgi:hypothetical protein